MSEPLRRIERGIKQGVWRLLALLFSASERQPQTPPDRESVRSVLVVRPDRLGDVILSTPVYESLKSAYPSATLTVLVDRAYEGVLADNPFIDRVFAFDRRRPLAIAAKLWTTPFDLAFTLNKMFSATASLLTLCSRATLRVGYDFPQNAWVHHLRVPPTRKIQHEIENNLDLLRELGLSRIAQTPRLFFNRDEALKIEELFQNNRRFPERPLVLIKPGTRIEQWGWHPDKFAVLADTLLQTEKAEVFFITGPGEEPMINSMLKRMKTSPFCLPPLAIKELALAIQQSDLLVCNHTGIMHLASAVKTPVLAIFKHGEVARWGPTNTPHVILEERSGSTLDPDTVREGIVKLLRDTTPRTEQHPESAGTEHP